MEISPAGGLAVKGEPVKLEVVVRDQNREVMEVPSWAPPIWSASDEAIVQITPDGTMTPLQGGETAVTAELAGVGAATRFRINPAQVVLGAPVIYLTQAAQNRDGTVALIGGRRALLRVFMAGDETSYYGPAVRVTLVQDDVEVFREVFQPLTRVDAQRGDRVGVGRLGQRCHSRSGDPARHTHGG